MTTRHHDDIAETASHDRLWPLDFPQNIEKIYRAYNIEQNHKQVATALIIGICLADSFIISDYFVASHCINLFLVGRFLIITPLCLIAVALIWSKDPRYDLWVSIFPLVMTIVLSGLIMMTEGDFRTHYMFGNILLMICGCVIGRQRTIYAATTVLLQFLIYIFVMQNTNFISETSKPVSVLFCLSGAVMSVITAYALERFNRRSFLLGLRIQRLNQELQAQSLTDPLTKLANRRCFEQATTRHWDDHALGSSPISFVLIDVDRFKLFNDSYGHSAGDQCLMKIASCVAAEVPDGKGLAVRFGGEEIILFLPSADFTEARDTAERIRLSILREAIPFPAVQPNAVVSASFGVATATAADCSAAELVIRADTALYAAKRSGRNQVWPPLRQAVVRPGSVSALAQSAA